MKSLDVVRIDTSGVSEFKEVAELMASLPSQKIDMINWSAFSYKPHVEFRTAYNRESFFIRYDVTEETVLAEKDQLNQRVCEDSCVEFFVAPTEGVYLNIEFNCIGNIYMGKGSCRADSETQDLSQVEKIRTFSTLGNKAFHEVEGEKSWTLTVEIPLEILTEKNGDELQGTSMKANFYKCGENQKTPHYITWNSIETENPDFHRPEFFGNISFK